MNAPNQQGIMGLAAQGRMPQPQQQQQQPQGQPLNPQQRAQLMPGMGTPDQLAAMYHNKPQELQQSYAMSPDLMKSLALMKIKQALDSKSREDMIEKASKEGKPQTVTDKLESEVADQGMKLALESLNEKMGRQEQPQQPQGQQNPGPSQQQVAQNVAGKNPALDQGIASAPGAQSAAQPQAMAAGGIVAFSGEGPSDVDSAVKEEDKTTPAERWLREKQEAGELRSQLWEKYGGRAGVRGLFMPQTDAQRAEAKSIMDRLPDLTVPQMKALLNPPARGLMGTPEQLEAAYQGSNLAATATPTAAPPNPPPTPPAPAARPQPMAAPAAQAPAQTDEWSAAARTMMNQKPEDVRNQQVEWLKAQLAPGAADQAKLQAERIAGIEALRPPQRTMEDKIASALMGMGSSRYLGFGIANAAQQERAAQEAERARNMEIHNQIMDIKQKGLDLTRANLNAALTAGNEAYKETLQGKAKGLETGANIHKTVLERESAEEVARQNRASHVEAAKISSRNNLIDLYTTLGGGDIQKGWATAHPNDKKTLLDHFNDWLKNQSDLVKMAPQEEQMARFMGTVGRLVGSGKPTGTILDAGK